MKLYKISTLSHGHSEEDANDRECTEAGTEQIMEEDLFSASVILAYYLDKWGYCRTQRDVLTVFAPDISEEIIDYIINLAEHLSELEEEEVLAYFD